MTKISVIVATTTLFFAIACSQPDVVIRPGSKFTKNSSITLTAGQDNAIFKPELEKELVRRGFNVISDSVAQVVTQEKKAGDLKSAGVATTDGQTDKAAAKIQGDEVTEKKTSTLLKSEYTGKIEYLYQPGKHTVSRVNFTIIELKSGMVIASIGYEKSGKNPDIAKEIVKQLEVAMGGAI